MEPEVCCSAFRILNMIIWNKTFYRKWGAFLIPLYPLQILLSKLMFFSLITLLSWGFLISCLFLFGFLILCSSLVFGCLLHFPIFAWSQQLMPDYKIGGIKSKFHRWSQWGCYTRWSIPLMLLLKVPEHAYDCGVLGTACQYFWSCYFSWGWVLPFSCFCWSLLYHQIWKP